LLDRSAAVVQTILAYPETLSLDPLDLVTSKKPGVRGASNKPRNDRNYDKANILMPLESIKPRKPHSPPALVDLVVKWCQANGYTHAVDTITTESQKRIKGQCSWTDAGKKYPSLLEIFSDWNKMHPDIQESLLVSEGRAKPRAKEVESTKSLPSKKAEADVVKKRRTEVADSTESLSSKKAEFVKKKRTQVADINSDTSTSSESETKSSNEEGREAAGAPITPAPSASTKDHSKSVSSESESETSSSSSSASNSDSDSESDSEVETKAVSEKPALGKAQAAMSESSSEVSDTDTDSDSDSVDSYSDEDEQTKPENILLPASEAESSSEASDSTSESSSDESETDSESQSSEEEESSKPKAETKQQENPLKRKAPSSSSSASEEDSSDSDSESESDDEPKAKKAKFTQSSSSETSSESEDESEDEEMKDASSGSESDSSSVNNSHKNQTSTNASKTGVAKATPNATVPTQNGTKIQTQIGSGSDTSNTLHPTSPNFVPIPSSTMNPSSKHQNLSKKQERFSRIPTDQKVDPRFASNAYVGYDYAERAHRDLSITKGKGFTKEKNKKKRGAYRGGIINTESRGIKFDD
jgi:hypothetical protein